MKLYEKLADEIAELIRDGSYQPNQKLPSVRTASKAHNVSAATVFQAYYLLERRGLVDAHARSGYVVKINAKGALAQPKMSKRLTDTTEVAVSDLVFSVLDSIKDPDIVPFGSAFPSPDLFPLTRLAKSMTSALRNLPAQDILTKVATGNTHLKRQISLRYILNGTNVDLDELIITGGALEALNLCLQVVTKPGDLVAIESPTFYAALQILERLQLKAVEIPVHPSEGIDTDALEDSLNRLPIKVCWLMSSFQNPLGACLTMEKKQKIYDLLDKHNLPLIEDDVYSELYFGTAAPKPIKAFDKKGLVMHCGSFSKNLAPGYRVGWVSAGRYANAVNRLKLMTTISASVPAQVAIADYLEHGGYDRHLRKLRERLQIQQGEMLSAIAATFPKNTRVTQPNGGYFLWIELPEQMNSLRLFSAALAQGISIAPGPIFSAAQGFSNCLRLNYGYPTSPRQQNALTTLGRIASSL